MHVTVIGLGYVGAVTAASLAELGHDVVGVDVDPAKVAEMDAGRSPIVEPRLAELIASGRSSDRLRVTTSLEDGLADGEIALVCVGTPSRSDGTVDLTHAERVSEELGAHLAESDRFLAVVYRSTVPPGTVAGRLQPRLEDTSGRRAGADFGVAMAPEFLREGSGVADFFDPPFTVVGVTDDRTFERCVGLFSGIERPIHQVSIEAAESLKYACNAFHALKITFANEVGRLLGKLDVDAREVMTLFCEDDRLNISPAYLRPGFAFGGSCLPKDLRALMHVARERDVELPMLSGVMRSNELHVRLAARHVFDSGERDVALLGLSFKPETDDLRESPFVELAEMLVGKGVRLRIFDPIVNPKLLVGANRRYMETHLPHLGEMLVSTPEDALDGARVVCVGTSDPTAVSALLEARPARILDLSGRLGPEVEALPGYYGVAW